jgi:hypothetical protein
VKQATARAAGRSILRSVLRNILRSLIGVAVMAAASWSSQAQIATGVEGTRGPTTATRMLAPGNARPVTDLKPLMLQALAAGSATGILAGPAAEALKRRFPGAGPVVIEVTRLHALPRPGCSRLAVLTSQSAVDIGQGPENQTLRWEVGFCADGRLASPGEGRISGEETSR